MIHGCRVACAAVGAALMLGCGAGGEGESTGGRAAAEPSVRLRAALSQSADSVLVVPVIGGDTLHVSAQTREFYRRGRYDVAWVDGDGLSERGEQVLAVLDSARAEGLDADDYGTGVARRLIGTLSPETEGDGGLDGAARSNYLADLDLVLSEGLMRYAIDLVQGTVDPEDVGRAWRIPRSPAPTETVLRAAARGTPAQVIQELRPTSPHYARMVAALARLRQLRDAGGWPAVAEGTKLAEGDAGAGVVALRNRLAASDDPREAALARRGAASPDVYDRDLRDALRHFQARHGQDDDGQLGPGTLRELNHTPDERIAELKLNIDRWRWLPQDLGPFFVLVNVAGFELEVVENNRVIEAMNVVVGQPGWSTPVFADTMEHVVMNPYWTPTANILREDIMPAIARDPGYLEKNNFERTSDGTIRQRPGGSNALGRYKFMFPNSEDIYLHDTPADHLFSRARRDFSHGCVRLERPADLARLIIGRRVSSRAAADIDTHLAAGSEKWVKLRKPVPIYIVYFTAWVNADGTIRYHHDIYGHDEDLGPVKDEMRDDAVPARVALAR